MGKEEIGEEILKEAKRGYRGFSAQEAHRQAERGKEKKRRREVRTEYRAFRRSGAQNHQAEMGTEAKIGEEGARVSVNKIDGQEEESERKDEKVRTGYG